MGDNMVSAIQNIVERINGQRSSVSRLNQPTAMNESDQQVVHLFIDAGSSGKHIFPGISCCVQILSHYSTRYRLTVRHMNVFFRLITYNTI